MARAKTNLSKQEPSCGHWYLWEYLQGAMSLGFTLTNPATGEEWPKSDMLPGLIPGNRA
jgi:hypothetical protein